jgi:hypothetical protein
VEGQLRESKTLAAGHDLVRDGTAAQRTEDGDAKDRELDEAGQALGQAREDVQQVNDDLERADLPEGILAAPPAALAFLRALAAKPAGEVGPAHIGLRDGNPHRRRI